MADVSTIIVIIETHKGIVPHTHDDVRLLRKGTRQRPRFIEHLIVINDFTDQAQFPGFNITA